MKPEAREPAVSVRIAKPPSIEPAGSALPGYRADWRQGWQGTVSGGDWNQRSGAGLFQYIGTDKLIRLPNDIEAQVEDLAERLKRDYAAAFHARGGNIGAYWNRTSLNIEVLFGSPVGPGWSAHSRFARLRWWPFGRWFQVKEIADVEKELRHEIEDYLTAHQK